MNWYSHLCKTAGDHGDTLRGQFLKDERERLTKRIKELRQAAATGGPSNVLPRWRPDVRRKMLLLPPSDRIFSMSPYELREVDASISEIDRLFKRYSVKRQMEILGA